MTKRIIVIILTAVIFALLVGLIWFFFFRMVAAPRDNTGTFGTGQNKPSAGSADGTTKNNIPSNATNAGATGAQNGENTTGTKNNQNNITTKAGATGAQTVSGSAYNGVGGGSNIVSGGVAGIRYVPGVDWLGGSNTTGAGGGSGTIGGPTTSFIPKTINQLNDGTVSGTPGIIGTFGPDPNAANQGLGLAVGGVLGAAAGCAAYFAFQGAGTGAELAVGGTQALAGGYVLVYDFNANRKAASNQFKDIGDCLTRTIARAIIQQMTASIVNWINSGFNGQPSFVTNYQQFFTNVGDQAAGDFIRGTGLSFLCSPFQLQIRIAIAQSYAHRNAQSCTLTSVINNINGFMKGNFSQGGWGGLLSFTGVPTNNPFGAYSYAQIGLQNSINNAQTNANRNISPGGFISLQKCDPPGSKNCKVVTPGSAIENAMNTSQSSSFRSLELAKSFDEIINALITQLMVKTLYQGFSTLSGTQGYASNYLTPEQQKAQADATALLTDMQSRLQVAEQYGSIEQGSIADIQNTQKQIQGLVNCWETASSSPNLSEAKRQTAQKNATTTLAMLHSYDQNIDMHNANITRANQGLALLQDFQTRTISIASASDVATVTADYQRALTSGAIILQADVTSAGQNRTTLQSALATRNQQTALELQQCNEFK